MWMLRSGSSFRVFIVLHPTDLILLLLQSRRGCRGGVGGVLCCSVGVHTWLQLARWALSPDTLE